MEGYNHYAEAGQPSRLKVEWRRRATVEVAEKLMRGGNARGPPEIKTRLTTQLYNNYTPAPDRVGEGEG